MSKIKFESGNELTIKSMSTMGNIIVGCALEDVSNIASSVASEDLSKVYIVNDDGIIVGIYEDCIFNNFAYSLVDNDLALAIREKNEIEKMNEKINELEESQNDQDSAIIDLADAVFSE